MRVRWAFFALLLPGLAEAKPRVVVVQSDDLAPYTEPVPAFLKAVGEPVTVVNLHGRKSEADALVDRLRGDPPKAIFCLGAKAAYAVHRGLPDVPMIYTAVLQPERYGLDPAQSHGLYGIAASPDPIAYLSQVQGFFPDAKRIGWMHGPSVTEAEVDELRFAATAVGVELVVTSVSDPRHIRKAFGGMVDSIDAMWLPPDRDLLTTEGFRTLTEETRRRHMPLLVQTDNMVRAGGLFAVVADPDGVGAQAAEAAIAILEQRDVEMAPYPSSLKIALNLRTLELAEVPFDRLLLDFVDVRIE